MTKTLNTEFRHCKIVGFITPVPGIFSFVFPVLRSKENTYICQYTSNPVLIENIQSIENEITFIPAPVELKDTTAPPHLIGYQASEHNVWIGTHNSLAKKLFQFLLANKTTHSQKNEAINFIVDVLNNGQSCRSELFFEADLSSSQRTTIKIVGIGGTGINAINHIVNSSARGLYYIAVDTDHHYLNRSLADNKISLGVTGLGTGARPEAGRAAAEYHLDDIRESLKGTHMLFVTAGMGGGTGTGAAPIVAEVAREMGILTVGVVTKPFSFEGAKRMKAAEAGITEFSKHVDSLIVILNDKLMDVMGGDAGVDECFKAADDVLKNAVSGIAEIITYPGLVNVDFEDVRTVMGEMGRAMMGSAAAAGVDRARIAAEQAVASPLLEGIDLSGARGVLVNITASRSLKMKEVNEVMNTVKAFAAEDAHIIFGAVFDENMGEALRVTMVATGLSQNKAHHQTFEVLSQPVMQATGTHDAVAHNGTIDYNQMADIAAAVRKCNVTVEALANSDVDRYDIPNFLRKQAD